LCQLCFTAVAQADYRDDIGYSVLLSELGASMPDGTGVKVSQVEASTSSSSSVYLPDPNNAQFLGKIITDQSGLSSGVYSGHATGVGALFYGNSFSMTPGINTIDAYLADNWIGAGYLRGLGGTRMPLVSSSRVANHSWIGSTGSSATDSDLLRRVDWVVARDELIQVVGVNNGAGTNSPLLSSAYNVISVGRTDGFHTTGSPSLDTTYTAGRARPDIVAPMSSTSEATPVVASAAALLVEVGHNNPGLSTDSIAKSTTNRNGDVIYNAERSEVIKAALMAGADRLTNNASGANITDYRASPVNQTANGLDSRFGAGQVNVFNSYHIIAAGEQNSIEDGGAGAGLIGKNGFDYDPHFGGAGGSNSTATYRFSTTTALSKLSASLVWNIDIAGGTSRFSGAATLFDMDLLLYDVTGSQLLLADSASATENTENIWASLVPGRDYMIEVVPGKTQAPFDWDYALAWNVAVVPIPAALPLFISGLGGLFFVAWRRKK
jgi:hypothetical protein